MKTKHIVTLLLVLALGAGAIFWINRAAEPRESASHGHHHGHDDHADEHADHDDHDDHEAEPHDDAEHHIETTRIDEPTRRANGIETGAAGPADLPLTVRVYGTVRLNEELVKHISPRYSGILIEARAHWGDVVERGEVIARVESSDSLQAFDIRSAIAGEVIWVHAHEGEFLKQGQSIYEIADLSSVWIELHVPVAALDRVRPGRPVQLRVDDSNDVVTGEINYVSPLGSANSQTVVARVELPNDERRWTPGQFVRGEIIHGVAEAEVTVPLAALQTMEGRDVVFVLEGDVFEARPVITDRRGDGRVEIVDGLQAGETVVTKNSYLIKADILKSGAEHAH